MASKKIMVDIMVVDKNATKTINKTTKAVDGLAKSTEQLQGRTSKNKAETGLNNALLMETGRLASDASFGFQGMANNLGQVVSLLQISSKNSGGFVNALRDLGRSLVGVGGIMVGIQLLISFLPQISRLLKKSKEEASEFAGAFDDLSESVGNTAGDFEIYIKTLQSSTKSSEEKADAIFNLNKEFPDYIVNLDNAGISLDDVANKTDDAVTATNNYRQSILDLAVAQAAQDKIREIQSERIEILQKRDEKARELGFENATEALREFEKLEKDRADGIIALTSTVNSTLNEEVINPSKAIFEFGQARLTQIEEQTNALLKFVDIQRQETKERKKSLKVAEEKREYDMLEIDNFDAQIRSIRELGKIREFFFNRNLDFIVDESTHRLSAIELEEDIALASINALGLEEKITQQARTEVAAFFSKERTRAEKEALFELGDAIVQAAGESSTVGKAVALTMATINTYQGITKALAEISPPFSYVVAATTALKGFAAVKNILAAKVPYGSDSSSSGTSSSGVGVQAPNFNVVGASETSQLGMALAKTQGDQKVELVWDDLNGFNETERTTVDIASF
tara:strand:+ start:373 stop:2088 length:1716 start_codon:yes stop_codon:yes gene_type:complete